MPDTKKVIHKAVSFAYFLRSDPVGALRRFKGYFHEPLFLFQMGKVGSSTHRNTLQTLYHVYHLHTLDEFRLKHEGALKRYQPTPEKPFDIITIVREPIGRKISTFFQNLVGTEYPFVFGSQDEVIDAGVDELIRRFRLWEEGVEEATEWYEKHFEPATGICIYDYPFDREKGWSLIQSGNWRILLLRFSDVNTNHLTALNRFLSEKFGEVAKISSLKSSNVSSVKWYADLMKEFRSKIEFTREELDHAYDSRFMQYFHTRGEIQVMRSKWRVSG